MLRKISVTLFSLMLVLVIIPAPIVNAYSTGTWTQTSWVGGSGQTAWSDATKYNTAGGDGVNINPSNYPTIRNIASTVQGQTSMTAAVSSYTTTVSAPSQYSFTAPFRSVVIGGKLIAPDYSNHRVLIWNTIPTSSGVAADVVIGQPNMTSNTVNNGGIGANTLNYPTSVTAAGSKLIIADGGNRRVLIYNTVPTTNSASADVVVGQLDMISNSAYQGGAVAANGLGNYPDVSSDGTKLFIADSASHRVLIFNTIPTSNNASANVVVGQPDMASSTANNGGRGANTLWYPYGAYSDGTKLFISDFGNNRVLVFNTIPTSDNASADVVIGQADFVSGVVNQNGSVAANTISGPYGVFSGGTKLYIADYQNNRVLIYNTIPTSNNASADVVVGQPNMTSSTANNGGIGANTLSGPRGVYSDGTKLFVTDTSNVRVLIYNTIPTSNNASADVVIGQQSFILTSGTFTFYSYAANTLLSPASAITVNGKLIVSDSASNRVLIFNTIPTSDYASADVVIGQADFTSFTANQGGTVATNTLSGPTGLYSDGTKLFVVDQGNNRVLIYNTIPTSNNASADVVVGQPNMTSSTANNGGIGANTLSGPRGVYSDGTKLFISERTNNRVLIWNTIPTSNGASADVVVGQPNMTSSTTNNGGVAANRLGFSSSISNNNGAIVTVGTKLIIADPGNHRVLIFNTIPTANSASADVVLGQSLFTTSTSNNGGISASSMQRPSSVYSDGTKLFVVDRTNNRVLVFNTVPTVNFTAADAVIGQPNFTSSTANNGGIGAGTLSAPVNVFSDGTRLLIADVTNNRILIYSGAHSSILTSSTYDSGSSYTIWGPISSTTSVPSNTSLTMEVSTNSGSSWVNASQYASATFGPSQTLIYKATLSNTDGISTPILQDFSAPYQIFENVSAGAGSSGYTPPATPTPTPSPAASPSPVVSPTPSVTPAPSPTSLGLASPTPTTSPVSSTNVTIISNLQQQLNALISQLRTIIQERRAAGLSVPASVEALINASPNASFNRNLTLGSIGDDVKLLQQSLNNLGFKTLTGWGSPGYETDFFGSKTYQSVSVFQKAYNIPQTGYFGPLSRAKMNELVK